MQKEFILSQKDLKNGYLSEEVFSDYAGYPVRTFRLSDFSHWDILKSGEELTSDQLSVRSHDILYALSDWGNPDILKFYDLKEIESVASKPSACAYPSAIQRASHVLEGHLKPILSKSAQIIDRLFPGKIENALFNGGLVSATGFFYMLAQGEPVVRNLAAFVVRNNPEESAEDFWGRRLLINPGFIQPRTGLNDNAVLLSDLHELRHLRQTSLQKPKNTSIYLEEIDADLFSHNALRKAKGPSPELITYRHLRYASMLICKPTHWIAPALDALEAGETLPDFYSVFRATNEIQTRLALTAWGQPHKNIKSEELQATIGALYSHPGMAKQDGSLLEKVAMSEYIYSEWIRPKNIRNTPDVLYSMLFQLTKQEVFTNPLSRHIAHKIVAAAEHFNPALTQEPNPEKRVKIDLGL